MTRKYCKKCGKKMGFSAPKHYVDLDNFIDSICERPNKKRGKTLLCTDCFDIEFIKAGGEIRDYDKINSSSTTKFHFYSRITNDTPEYKHANISATKGEHMKQEGSNLDIKQQLNIKKQMVDLLKNRNSNVRKIEKQIEEGKIKCPKCGSNILSISTFESKKKLLVTIVCNNCPYMWDFYSEIKD